MKKRTDPKDPDPLMATNPLLRMENPKPKEKATLMLLKEKKKFK